MLVISVLTAAAFFAQSVEQGVAAFHRGEYESARGILLNAPESDVRNIFLGLAEAATGHCDTAIPRLQSPPAAQELRKLAGLGLIQCFTAQDRVADAVPISNRLQAELPSDPDVLYQAARLHMRGFNDAVSRMFQHTPASYRVNQLSGEIFELQGRIPEAVAEYRKALAKNPVALNLHYRLGRALALQSEYEEALREFTAELRLNPSDALAEYQVAQLLAVQGKPDAAVEHFQKALTLKPHFVEAMIALAKLRPQSALGLLEKAVQLAPRNEPARYALMLAYRDAGRLDEAHKQKLELDKLQQPGAGEFADFLRKLGEKPAQ